MTDFFEWKIRHEPDSLIETEDRWFLWDMENMRQAVLVFEDWELRVYTYDWDSNDDDSPVDDWWRWCWDIFQSFSGYYDEYSIGYVKVEAFGSAEEIADNICQSCNWQLFCPCIKELIFHFINAHWDKIIKWEKVYTYYK